MVTFHEDDMSPFLLTISFLTICYSLFRDVLLDVDKDEEHVDAEHHGREHAHGNLLEDSIPKNGKSLFFCSCFSTVCSVCRVGKNPGFFLKNPARWVFLGFFGFFGFDWFFWVLLGFLNLVSVT